jgi:S1-C subfamily serine protease
MELVLPVSVFKADAEPVVPLMFPAICLVWSKSSYGTGFFLGERGNIITAGHSVRETVDQSEPPEAVVLVLWGYTNSRFRFCAPAEVVREDWRTDLALLRLMPGPSKRPMPQSPASLTVLSSSPAMLGDQVFFETFRRDEANKGRFEFERVHARVVRTEAVAPGGLEQRLLLLDAQAWPGASGSPVFSKTGEVIGIATGVLRKTNQTGVRDARWIAALWDGEKGGPSNVSPPVILFPGTSSRPEEP